MKRNQILELMVEEVKYPNKGISTYESKKVVFKGGIVGQKVKIRVKKKKRDIIEGNILEILEKSPLEIESKCVHFGVCGGCTYQNLSYEEQLKLKKNQVLELFENIEDKSYEFKDIVPSPEIEEYRNKMEFSFGDIEKDGPLSLGLHQKGRFYEIVTTENCKIVDEDFGKILLATLGFFKEKKTPYYHKGRHEGILRHLVVRKTKNKGEILLNLVISSQGKIEEIEWAEIIKNLELDGNVKGILVTINDSLADIVQSDETRIIYGEDTITENLLGLEFEISPFSFFQTNSKGAEKLYSIVREFVGETKDKTIFDLYCGTGTISQILAPVAKKVYGIEIVEEAIENAIKNAEKNKLENCHFIAGDVMLKVDELEDKPDIIVLDPPRDGIHPKAISKIIDFNPNKFIYVSCKPSSLVRDLPYFIENGYKIEKVQPVDMFPSTPHVETVVLMSKKK